VRVRPPPPALHPEQKSHRQRRSPDLGFLPQPFMSDARISRETLRRLEESYHALALMPDFPTLSRFERWLRLCHRLEIEGAIEPREVAALDALNIAQKTQLLDWLESPRERVSLAR